MKRRLLAALALSLCCALCLCACTVIVPTTPVDNPSNGTQTDNPADDKPKAPGYPDGPLEEMMIEVNSIELDGMEKSASTMRFFREDFTDSSTLSDEALFYAAMRKLSSSFIPAGTDNTLYKLDISEIPLALRSLFGERAALSDSWANNDYSPYSVDLAAGLVYLNEGGGLIPSQMAVYAVKTDGDTYELHTLELWDPLFANDPANTNYLLEQGAEAVTWDMVKAVANDMMMYRYVLKGDGRNFTIVSLETVNEKDITPNVV